MNPATSPFFNSLSSPSKSLKEMARQQLGTVGSGNHYVDIFEDEMGRIWIGVHFGSRGLGHKTATWFLKAAGAKDGMDVKPCILPVDSHLGAEYLEGMRLGGYAYAGRDWVCGRVEASVRLLSRRFTITTTSPGERVTRDVISGWCEKARRRHFLGRADLSVDRWRYLGDHRRRRS